MYGKILSQTGMLVNNEHLQLVHIQLAEGESVPSHDHKGQEVFFTLVRGQVEITLASEEQHILEVGQVLHFPGETAIGVKALAESEFFAYLINRK